MLGQLARKALCASLLLCPLSTAFAQTSARNAPQPTIPALFLSDIHLDVYHDPAKVARLNSAPASEWPAILAAPDSPERIHAAGTLQATCPVRGFDTPDTLWRSSLRAIRTQTAVPSARPRFITISGDLLAHSFDCKYHSLLPQATHDDYVAFTEKTIRYIVTSLRAAVPNTPIYVALGNNDSGCTDYQLNPTHDDFLTLTAKIVAEAVPPADSAEVLATFDSTGSYSVPLAAVPNTRLIVLDDLFLSLKYATCSSTHDPAPAKAQIAWLAAQLSSARDHHERVWIMGHIPPGIDMYSTARNMLSAARGMTDMCSAKPVPFLNASDLGQTLAANADIIPLALFGHTHSDEMQLLTPSGTANSVTVTPQTAQQSVPVKFTSSISPVNGNRPTFTLARIDPATATLRDYTVFIASNATGINATWTKEYTYSSTYHKPAFDSAALEKLVADFQADPQAQTAESKAFLRNFFPGDISTMIQGAWPQYACGMNHTSAESFAGCLCPAKP